MSKKKSKQTPAEVASEIAKFLAKQEETLSRYPVGPMANAARMNMKKGYAALEALKGQNESMRTQMPGQAGMMTRGGDTAPADLVPASESGFEISLRQYNPGNLMEGKGMLEKLDDERFATFPTLEAGWNALIRQLDKYAGKNGLKSNTGITGESTLAEAMGKYAPKYENDTEGYINTLANAMGVTPDTKIKELDNKEWATAISRVEGSQGFAALDAAGLLDEGIASQFRDSTAVQNARPIAERFTSRMATIPEDRDTTQYANIFNSTEALPDSRDPSSTTEVEAPATATTDAIPEPREPRNASEKEMLARAMGWTPETNISATKFIDKYNEAEKKNPGKSLTFFPDSSSEDGGFFGTAGSVGLAPAEVVTELPRGEDGRPIFTGMRQKNNYYANYHLGEQGLRQMEDMRGGIHEATGQFARNFLQPTLLGGLAVTGLPALTSLGAGLSGTGLGAAAGEFGTALNTIGRGFMQGNIFRPAIAAGGRNFALNAPGLLGAGSLAAGVSSGLSRATGDYGLTDRENAYQYAMNPNISAEDKAAYFATLGIELSPIAFNSPTAIKNIFRGRPSDYPGSYSSYLMARRGLINTADEGAAATRATEDAFQASRAARTKTKTAAANAESKAATAETKAAKAQAKADNLKGEYATKPVTSKAQAKADKAADKAARARTKANAAQAADDAALTEQQAANARRLNARGRAGVADDELAAFNRQYNAARTPYGLTPGQKLPAQLAGLAALGQGFNQNITENVDPASVNPMDVQVRIGDPPIPPDVRTVGDVPGEVVAPPTGGGEQVGGGSADPIGDNFDDGTPGGGAGEGSGTAGGGDVAMTPDMYNLNMGKGNMMMGIPALAALGSAAIQNRALQQMQAPQAPITTDIPAFNYESTIGQQLQDVRDNTRAMSQVDGLSAPQQAAMRQGLMGQRFRQEQRLRSADNEARQNARRSYDLMATQVRQANNALRNQYLEDARTFRNDMTQARADIKQAPLDVASNFAQDYLKNIYFPQQNLAIEQVGRLGQYGLPQGLAEEQKQD